MSGLLLGVDAGAANIKIVELKEKKSGYVVKNMIAGPTPDDTITDGMVMDHLSAAKGIKACLEQIKGYTRDAAFGMRGRDIVVKRIKFPWNGKGSFHETFIWGAEQYIGIKANKASFDAQLLNYDKQSAVADAVVAAANKEKVGDCVSMAKYAGLNPVVVDMEALSLVNLADAVCGKQKHPDAIIDIGHDSTNVIFYDDGYVDMVKSIPRGCKYLIEDIAQDMDVDTNKAMMVVKNKETMKNDIDAQAAAMSFGTGLGAEVETAVEAYIHDKKKEPVDFYLCGAGCYVPGVKEQMEISLKLALKILDPFETVELPPQFANLAEQYGRAAFAVAVGLAMRKA